MSPEYDNIYEQFYLDYIYELGSPRNRYSRFFPNEALLLRATRRAIDKADRNATLRPDARYFLLVNFHHMIILPMLSGRYGPQTLRDSSQQNIQDAVEQDRSSIVQAAAETAIQNRDQQPISGHQIMNAVNRSWDRLRTTKFDIWG